MVRMRAGEPLLIVATWGRPLAQSAARAGRPCVVLDLFADADTRHYARAAAAVRLPDTQAIDVIAARRLAQQLAPDCSHMIYGAGFEHVPEEIVDIAAGRGVFGNNAATIHLVKQPESFFALLDSVGMPYPETSITRPTKAAGWLAKRVGAQGGAHIHTLSNMALVEPTPDMGMYYQRYVEGRSHSVLFLADGQRAQIVGWNEQLVEPVGAAQFCYAGALADTPPDDAVVRALSSRLDDLVEHAGLVGLNSLDFIALHQRYAVLEVNPRPSATIDLYDDQVPSGLVAWHIAACQGHLEPLPVRSPLRRGHAVVHARSAGAVPSDFGWPVWCSDTDAPGSAIAADAPVCLVHAQEADALTMKRQLAWRARFVREALGVA